MACLREQAPSLEAHRQQAPQPQDGADGVPLFKDRKYKEWWAPIDNRVYTGKAATRRCAAASLAEDRLCFDTSIVVSVLVRSKKVVQ